MEGANSTFEGGKLHRSGVDPKRDPVKGSNKGSDDVDCDISDDPPKTKPVDVLKDVISEELAKDFISHRKALKKPLTLRAAQIIAKKLQSFPNAEAAVEVAIERGWQTVYEASSPQRNRSTSPVPFNPNHSDQISQEREKRERFNRLQSAKSLLDFGGDPTPEEWDEFGDELRAYQNQINGKKAAAE